MLDITAVRTNPIGPPLDAPYRSGPGLGVKLNRAAVEKWRLDR